MLVAAIVAVWGANARAACIDHGHYSIVAAGSTLRGTPYPYTEDLAWKPDVTPVPDGITVAYHDDGRWTKVQSGCTSHDEKNVWASDDVNLLLRASFNVAPASRETLAAGTRIEVQLRLDNRVVLDEVRRSDEHLPQSIRFGTSVANLAARTYVYSMWIRLLDGPDTNRATLGLQWITAQGVPASYPAAESIAAARELDTEWTRLTKPMPVRSRRALDLELVASVDVTDAKDGAALELAFAVDGERAHESIVSARSVTAYDTRAGMPRGEHEVALWARATRGTIRIASARSNVVAFPREARARSIVPLQEASASDPIVVTTQGSAEKPTGLSPICGEWTKLLDFRTEDVVGDFSWVLMAYIEFLDVDEEVSGYGQVAIEAVMEKGLTDMGMANVQVVPGGDGIFFYGDCSSWGNDHGNHMTLWARRIDGCDGAPFGGTFTVGTRRLAIKLMPSTSTHLP
ncbi:MAG TPA: hypothetical protein VFN10_22410 [Thermoanaerobaculia bacterium]|nr:hypothetical protein [Thermoanaerobaculia bacterium]